MLPEHISDLFAVRNNVKKLRGTNKLVVPRKNTTTFGLNSKSFIGAKVWNSDPYRMNYAQRQFLRNAVRELHLQCTVY